MYFLDSKNISHAKITLLLILVNIFFFVAFNLILNPKYQRSLILYNTEVIEHLECWRLFTSLFIHMDVLHLCSNLIALFIFGVAVENKFRRDQYIIIYIISGFIGNFFSLILLPLNAIILGASGAVFGLIGASFVLYWKEGDKALLILGLLYLIYFIIASLTPNTNLWAHLFGLIGGILFGKMFYQEKKISNSDYNYD